MTADQRRRLVNADYKLDVVARELAALKIGYLAELVHEARADITDAVAAAALAPGERALLTRAEVARKLGHGVDWLYNHYAALRAEGFPAPAYGTMSGARWDPAAIDRWLDRRGGIVAPAADADADAAAAAADSLADQTHELLRRSSLMAEALQ